MFTIPLELLFSSVPVAAAFPPPKTCFPTTVLLSISRFVFPYTTANKPFPPAYILFVTFTFDTYKLVFSPTMAAFPPP